MQEKQVSEDGAARVFKSDPDPQLVRELLMELPEWFGIESAIDDYVRAAGDLDTWVAVDDRTGESVGILLLARHFVRSAEVYLMAVAPGWHRRGVGRRLLAAAEAELQSQGTAMISVKTLGPSHPDHHYASTRLFYEGMGFIPLEEIHGIWPGNPCLILAKPVGG